MQDALLYISATLTVIALVLLLTRPLWGLMAIFFVRPFVDTTWAQPVLLDFKLTEIISSFVPLIVLGRILFIDDPKLRLFKDMPLKWDWVICSADAVFFSSLIMFQQDWRSGLSVLMRHMNGITGFYMVQAYCRNERDFLHFCWAVALAGLFPMATGVWEGVTGEHWTVTIGTNDVVRNIGLYHDAITIRCFAEQTIIALLLIVVLSKRSLLVTLLCAIYGLIAVYVVKGAVSKSGTLTLMLWLGLWPILRNSVKGIIALGIGLAVACAYFAKEIMQSFGFVFTHELDLLQGHAELENTFAGRWLLWEDMAKEWQTFGPFKHVFGAGKMANGAHNDYLQVLFHGGYVGLGIYIFLLASVAWVIARYMIQKLDVWAITALFVYIMWMVDTVGLIPSAFSVYQWFAWGMIGFCLRYRQDERLGAVPAVTSTVPRFAHLMGAT